MVIEEDLSEWEIASTKKMASYGFGYLIINYLLGAYSAVVFYFYEVEVGLPVLYVGIAFIIYAIWNMFNDPLLGYFTDKSTKWSRKYGFRAPWIVISAYPILIFYYLIFNPPDIDPKKNALLIFLYMVLITALFDTFFSIYNTHVYGGFTNQFRSEYERRKGFAVILIVMSIGIFCIRLIPPFIIEFGSKRTFALSALITCAILGICNVFLFLGIKESDELKERLISGYETDDSRSFFKIMKVALKKKNFLISLIAYTTVITAQTLAAASGIYMLKDVLKVPFTYAIYFAIAGFMGSILFIPFWSNYARKHGFKKTYYITLFLAGICYLPTLFVTEVWQAVLFIFIGSIAASGYILMLMPVASDTMDEVALEMGRRQDGVLQGIRNFFFRIAIVVQGIVITAIHIITNYNPNPNATQTPLAIIGIRIHAGLIPALLMFTISFIVYKWYTLDGEIKAEMVKKLRAAGL